MRSRVLVGLSALALVGTAFISPAAAAPASVDAVTAAALLGAMTNVPAADAPDPAAALQGDPIPDLADAIKKAKTDRENLVTQTERQEAAERSGITAPDISKAQLAAFARTQAALQGSAGGQKATTKAVTATADPHYFGPYANYANSPQHLPTALVTFAPPPAGPGAHTALGTAVVNEAGSVTGVTITDPGAGYLDAPAVSFASVGSAGSGAAATAVLNGTLDNLTITNPGSGYSSPVVVFTGGGLPDGSPDHAAATATIGIDGVITALNITKYGSGYTSAPTVEITSSAPGYTPAEVVATVTSAVASVTVTSGGAGYVTPGIRKFVDGLAGLGAGGANNLGQFIPVAVPDTTTYPGADYYEIGVVQYREKLHSDLPATLLRGYVQLSTAVVPGGQVALSNAFVSGPDESIVGYRGVTAPHYLGPVISSTKDRPVRVLFRNLLPEGVKGDLFLPVDTTVMGAGQGPALTPTAQNNWGMGLDPQLPECGQTPKPASCFTENRAVAHLHGGATPWISDGTPHQWTTPAGDTTVYPEGVSVKNVPDMPDPGPGAQTFFYTNQQSARMLFYHDHAWGITRLNVYAGLAAGYLITDDTEKALIADGTIPGANDTIPLIVEDKTFVPTDAELAVEDPTWNSAKWGGIGSLWLPHVYMTAQNPYDVSGVNQFGRWAFGPWFWPPTNSVTFPPIANPWAPVGSFPGAECDPNTQECDPAAWSQIPATPTPSMGMEAFADTPVINGTVYPKVTLEPKSYRFRVLNAANDRFFNLSLYEASGTGCNPTTGSHCTEVALNPAEVAAAKTDPIAFPTPIAKAGPDWVQIATESGFLANPAVIPAQPITWVTDPTVFNAGNVDKHSLLVGPAERADVVVDFSKWAGKTLILYNDAPAAFPARDPRYDYYTDDADLRDTGGANTTPEGYGPNTRTIMQITIAGTPAPAFNTTKLNKAFAATSLGGGGVFEKSQHPIVVGQAAYNEAYDTSFGNAPFDGYARITDSTLTFHTLTGASDTNEGATVTMNLGPKAMHDEMGASWDNMFGRMSGNLGLEMPNNQPGQLQNLVLYPYVNPPTETFLGEALPAGTRAVPIVELDDGTQIWKITHNGVDTHPIHFHFSDVQVVNRVGWDGIIRPPDPNEIGWKDTVRISPLEDTIVAMRPLLPQTQFGIEQSKRPLNPSLPIGSGEDFINIQPPPQAQSPTLPLPTPWTLPLTNAVVNLDWEYVWHCHILSHEEMDMMRPLTVSVPVTIPDASEAAATSGGGVALSWTDPTPTTLRSTWGNPKNEVGYDIQRAPYAGAVVGTWAPLANATALANATTYTDATGAADTFAYKVVSWNAAGEIESNAVVAGLPAPTGLHAVPTVGSSSVDFDWTAPGGTVTGYRLQRSPTANGPWLPVVSNTGSTAVTASATVPKGTWFFRVAAFRGAGGNLVLGEYSGVDSATVGGPAGPQITELTPAFGPPGVRTTVTITGLNLAGATDVTFGGAPGAIQGSPTATSITVRTPAHTAGKVDVVVTTPDGEATLVDGFLFGTVTTPGVPRAVQGLRGVGLVAVSWAAPLSNGGRDISGYTARVYTAATGGSPVGTCTTTTGTSCQVTGLANGASFFVDVFATNVMGDGAANSPRVATTTATVPTMPQSVATGPADSAAVIAWLAPLNNGGTPVTGYVATLWTAPVGGTSAGSCTTSGALTCAIGGLTNGVTYYADVYSTNLVGTGAASSPRVSVVPAVQGGGGGGGAGGGGGGAGGGSGGSDGSAAGGGSAAGPGSTTPTSPVAPTVPNTPRPVPALPPWKFMPNPQEAQYLGGGVTVVSKVQAQGLARVIMHSPPTSSAAKAPVAPVKATKITRVKIVGIPITKRSTIVVKIRIQGKYVDLGSVRTNSSGVIALPALRLVKPGDYLVSLASGGKTWYVTIQVK